MAVPTLALQAQKGGMITFRTSGEKASAYLVDKKSDKYLLMIHKWWALNEQIKLEAEKYSDTLDINVLALDMYDGKVASDASMARKYTQELSEERAAEISQGAINFG